MDHRTAANYRGSKQHNFAQIPSASIQRSRFSRSHGLKTAFDSAYLIPVLVDEVLPGDTFSCRMKAFVRMTTPLYAVMDNLWLDTFFFFVPNRLLWDKWQRFCGEQPNPGDSTSFVVPQMTDTVAEKSLSDYFGIPIGNALTFNSLHHRAYNLCWREWFRSEDLQDSPVVDTGDGPDDPADYVLLKRGKRHDYFTSCLPFAQKGDPVELPLGSTAPVTITGAGEPTFDIDGTVTTLTDDVSLDKIISTGAPSNDDVLAWSDPKLSGSADLSSATAATINDIRQAFQIQRLLERDARGGSRYTEIIRSHFGVVSADARLQRPEFLGGGTTRINANPVYNVSEIIGGQLGTVGAFVTGYTDRPGFFKSFTEHGVILGLVSVRADLTYQQGLDRMWSRQTRFDYYWPALAHLGEQAVLSQEIFADGTGDPVAGTGDYSVFGYQERYAEYRYKPSRVSGTMRSDAAAPIDAWHLALDFASRPLLNDTFIEESPPVPRILATLNAGEEFFGDFWFDYSCARPMPTYSVPGLVDHF